MLGDWISCSRPSSPAPFGPNDTERGVARPRRIERMHGTGSSAFPAGIDGCFISQPADGWMMSGCRIITWTKHESRQTQRRETGDGCDLIFRESSSCTWCQRPKLVDSVNGARCNVLLMLLLFKSNTLKSNAQQQCSSSLPNISINHPWIRALDERDGILAWWLHKKKRPGITKVIQIHPLRTMNAFTKNIKYLTDRHYHPLSPTAATGGGLYFVQSILKCWFVFMVVPFSLYLFFPVNIWDQTGVQEKNCAF